VIDGYYVYKRLAKIIVPVQNCFVSKVNVIKQQNMFMASKY